MTRTQPTTGLERIAAAFAAAQKHHHAALMPYFTLGFPTQALSLDIVAAIAPFSDLLELGVPFSDPIADGPTIQRSTQISLEQGTTLTGALAMVRTLRDRGVATPALLFSYFNPLLAYGEERLARDAAAAGVDGFIVPDLPPEEADALERAAAGQGLALVYFLAPTSNPKRIADVCARARGFLYMVSVTGITGARSSLRADLAPFVRQIKAQAQVPVAVGFGISTPELAAEVGAFADGVIVGSALIDAVSGAADPVRAAHDFVATLRDGLVT